jgi:hypothetical protein
MKVLVYQGTGVAEFVSADSVKVIFEDGDVEVDDYQRHYTLNDEGIVFDAIIDGEIEESTSITYNEIDDAVYQKYISTSN